MRVYICCPRRKGGAELHELDVSEGAVVADALESAGFPRETTCGIFCEKCTPETVLKPDDRIDIAVALALSPMEVRRLRAHRTRSARPSRARVTAAFISSSSLWTKQRPENFSS